MPTTTRAAAALIRMKISGQRLGGITTAAGGDAATTVATVGALAEGGTG